MLKTTIAVLAGLSALAAWGCGKPHERAVHVVESPAVAPQSAEPELTVGADGNLYLSWIEADGDGGHVLKFSRWTDAGWSDARVVSRGADWFVNWADYPTMTALEDGTLFAHWLAKTGRGTYAYGIQVSVSQDGGATWSDPIAPHRDGTDTYFGFVSMVPVAGDRVGLVWLGGEESEKEATDKTLHYATVDRDGTIHDGALLDPRVCDCCSTGAVLTEDGSIIVVYRDRSDEEVRDISVIRKESEAWGEPATIHADNWKINGCPVNGPEIDAAGERAVATWFTVDAKDRGHVRTAFSSDGGRSFGAPIEVDDGNPLGRVDVVLDEDGSAIVSWLEEREQGAAEFRLRRVGADGTRGAAVVVAETSATRGSGFPRMARSGKDVFLAWTHMPSDENTDQTRVRTAVYR